MSTATDQLISAVDFVGIPTRDLERAVGFYGETLGLRRSVYMPERNFAEFETGNLTLSVIDAEKMGLEHHAVRNADRAARRRRRGRASDARGPRRDVRGRHVRHRRLPHGVLPDPDGNALMLHHRYAPRDRVVSRTHPGRAGN